MEVVVGHGNKNELGGALHLTYGTMAAGKSTLALQLVWQLRELSEKVDLWTFGDRSNDGMVTSRIGIAAPAQHIEPGEDMGGATRELIEAGVRMLVVDEAQFASPSQVDALAALVDDHGVTVHCFALATDFRSEVFPGTARLFALADVVDELPLSTYCWCGQRGRCNARVVNGKIVKDGDLYVIGDVVDAAAPNPVVSYQVLCRKHFRVGQIAPGG